MNILFVCTGNICRSPSAEALLKHKLAQRGITSYHIDSAGVAGYHIGNPPDHRAIISAQEYGVDMSSLQARKVKTEDFQSFDIIFAMDRGHLATLQDDAPQALHHKIKLFNHEVYGHETDVEDPYYGGQADFDIMFKKLDHGLDILVGNPIQKHRP
jgi:protein-tyrosine phosphatase|tara:strand:- start:226177 stop:226644 length:468 start_codon:yes stop_codon:yes gene_type:complete